MRLDEHALRMTACAADYHAAVDVQNLLRARLRLSCPARRVNTVAGADVAFAAGGKVAIAGFVVFTWPALERIDLALAAGKVAFPYIPGLLSFREIPVLCAAYRGLSVRPDVVFCDGQGYAHPRRFGLACHLGVVLGTPTIGCAKSILVGAYGRLGEGRGARSELVDDGEPVGVALRTRDGVEPMYISAGHMMDVGSACNMALTAGGGFRVPEPTRAAHALVTHAKRAIG